jgi:Xaa-Pro aminopeptidase
MGVQAAHMTLQAMRRLEEIGKVRKAKPIDDVPAPLRIVKDASEVQTILKAVRAAQRAFAGLFALGRRGWIGRTERDLAAELEYRMRQNGADEPSFETIIAAGAHSSLPHYRPASTRVKADSCVLVDWGARVNGYCSDLTRVVYTGTIPPRLAEIYAVVLSAQEAGMAACRAGATCQAVDGAARGVIERAGYGKQFLHGLGHGVGLEIHEPPTLGRTMATPLKRGMVVTIEPGIYLPGVGGVRIEDDFLITAGNHDFGRDH